MGTMYLKEVFRAWGSGHTGITRRLYIVIQIPRTSRSVTKRAQSEEHFLIQPHVTDYTSFGGSWFMYRYLMDSGPLRYAGFAVSQNTTVP